MAKPTDYWKIGAIAGVLGTVILGTLSKVASMIPGVTLDLQSITVSTTGLGSTVNVGLSKYAKSLLGIVPVQLSGMEWLYAAIGGALFLMLGAYIVQKVKQLQFAKSKEGKLATIFVVAGVVTGWILSMSLTIPALSGVIVMAVDALILSYILVWLDKALKTKLIP